MLSNWLSKGSQIITVGAKTISQVSQVNNPNVESVMMTKEILSKIEAKLNKQLGENVAGSLDSFNNEILKQTQLQKSIIEIKQKYNNLVSQSEVQGECLKQMMQYFTELFRNLANTLKNDDMITPLKDIQSAFLSYNVSKVEKQLKYFSKLYEAALQDYLRGKLNNKEGEKRDEITLFKTLNRNLQVELLKSRNNSSDLEKRLNEVHCKNQELMVKVQILQKLGAENAVLNSNKQKEKFQERETELLQKIRHLQKEKYRLERINRQADIQIVKVNSALEVLKANQENIVEELKREMTKKQSSYEMILTKIRNEKLGLEDKIKAATEQLILIKEELSQMKKKESFPKKDPHAGDLKDLIEKNKQLQEQITSLRVKVETLVSKDIMKNLFLSFDDESKQWSVRKDIKNQIYSLLDIKPKKIEKVDDKKWFGLF